MKSYLKQHPPVISIILVALLFVFALLVTFVPAIRPYLMLDKADLSLPSQWFRLVSYSLYFSSLQHWLIHSLILLLLGTVIEKQMRKPTYIIGIIIGSSIIGGISFALLSPPEVVLAWPGMIVWGYCSTTIVLSFKHRHSSESLEKVAGTVAIIRFVWLIMDSNLTPYFLTQMIVIGSVGILVGILVWLDDSNHKAKDKRK